MSQSSPCVWFDHRLQPPARVAALDARPRSSPACTAGGDHARSACAHALTTHRGYFTLPSFSDQDEEGMEEAVEGGPTPIGEAIAVNHPLAAREKDPANETQPVSRSIR